MNALRATVSGLVQGVGFRYFVQRHATVLGLRGYVRNLPTGEVELLAIGEREALDRLLGDVRRGPRSAMVSGVTVQWEERAPSFAGFEVR